MQNKIQPRWAAFKRLYPDGDKYQYMGFIRKMIDACFPEHGRVLDHEKLDNFIDDYVASQINIK